MSNVIPAGLRTSIEIKLGKVSDRHVNRLIAKIASDQFVSRRAAAMLLARKLGVNFSRYATPEDLAEMKGHKVASSTVEEPTPAATSAPKPVSDRQSSPSKDHQG